MRPAKPPADPDRGERVLRPGDERALPAGGRRRGRRRGRRALGGPPDRRQRRSSSPSSDASPRSPRGSPATPTTTCSRRSPSASTARLERPVKAVELDALLAAPEGYGDDVPIDPDFHARRLPDHAWRSSSLTDGIGRVVALHRLREVLCLLGFTRFEAVTPDIQGEYEGDVERAALALEPTWFPAVENRGEGVFVGLDPGAVADWLRRDAVARASRPARRGTPAVGCPAQERASVPGRAICAASHALAPAAGVPGDALRLSGELDPRADLRRQRRRTVRADALHREPGRRGHARWPRRPGPAHRRPPRGRAPLGRAVL